ncbi:hypothetical protein BEWA_037360 [Theileria equi strain WA]|uniref:VASt domain-containing protein n=1 Tax=Theileria equi strain WA TaxID=1537102 RepID=L1LEL9_THEEQ|nr:hypothetical protein BEWA_037360 [Theileria equi strain WA]EKX73700.1 hypothetical protein BEWA_037360 [Theileria equi strain WA]|eukprot:XP_004833152.1 hypothetical protein BEWA_037360 [Theileria equi strain WA]
MPLFLSPDTHLLFLEKIYELNHIYSKHLSNKLNGLLLSNKDVRKLENLESFRSSVELENRLKSLRNRILEGSSDTDSIPRQNSSDAENSRNDSNNLRCSSVLNLLSGSNHTEGTGHSGTSGDEDDGESVFDSSVDLISKHILVTKDVDFINFCKNLDQDYTPKFLNMEDIKNMEGIHNKNVNVTARRSSEDTKALSDADSVYRPFTNSLSSLDDEIISGFRYDILENEMVPLTQMCRALANLLFFSIECMNSSLYGLDKFEALLSCVIGELGIISKESDLVLQRLKEELRTQPLGYLASLSDYERCLSKLYKLEKNLENSIYKHKNEKGNCNLPDIECKYLKCSSNSKDHKARRDRAAPLASSVLSDSRDFVRYTNYIEQLSVSQHSFDALNASVVDFESGLDSMLTNFSQHYKDQIFSVQQSWVNKLASFSPILLSKGLGLSKLLQKRPLMPSDFPKSTLHCSFELNVESLRENVFFNIKKGFECLRAFYRQMSRFHKSRYNSLSGWNLRSVYTPLRNVDSPNVLSDATNLINKYFSSYCEYHKNQSTLYLTLYNLISEAFPQTLGQRYNTAIRRIYTGSDYSCDKFQDSELSEFDLSPELFKNVAKLLESVVETSVESALGMCNTSLQILNCHSDWTKLPALLASQFGLSSSAFVKRISLEGPSTQEFSCKIQKEFPDITISDKVISMVVAMEMLTEALVDYSEPGYDFSFQTGDIVHVKIAGSTSLWYGHADNGLNRWFPAKFVKPLAGFEAPWYRFSDVDRETPLDCHVSGSDKIVPPSARALTSRGSLKQSLVLSKIGLKDKVECEFKCALVRKIVLHGSMYITRTHLGFFSQFNDSTIFGTNTHILVPLEDIVKMYTKSKRVPVTIVLILKDGTTHSFYGFSGVKKIYAALSSRIGDKKVDFKPTPQLESLFGSLQPLKNTLLSQELSVSLQKFYEIAFGNNVEKGFAIADTRLAQQAFEFEGDISPVVFDWKSEALQFNKIELSYKFRLKEGKASSRFIPCTCGKTIEDIRYALVDKKYFVYQSTSTLQDIPYSKYFNTVFRVIGTSIAENRIHLQIETEVVFVKQTLFSGIITSEALEKLEAAAKIIQAAFPGEHKPVQKQDTHKSETQAPTFDIQKHVTTILVVAAIGVATRWFAKSLHLRFMS